MPMSASQSDAAHTYRSLGRGSRKGHTIYRTQWAFRRWELRSKYDVFIANAHFVGWIYALHKDLPTLASIGCKRWDTRDTQIRQAKRRPLPQCESMPNEHWVPWIISLQTGKRTDSGQRYIISLRVALAVGWWHMMRSVGSGNRHDWFTAVPRTHGAQIGEARPLGRRVSIGGNRLFRAHRVPSEAASVMRSSAQGGWVLACSGCLYHGMSYNFCWSPGSLRTQQNVSRHSFVLTPCLPTLFNWSTHGKMIAAK